MVSLLLVFSSIIICGGAVATGTASSDEAERHLAGIYAPGHDWLVCELMRKTAKGTRVCRQFEKRSLGFVARGPADLAAGRSRGRGRRRRRSWASAPA